MNVFSRIQQSGKCLLLPVSPKSHRLKCLPFSCQFCHPVEWKARSEPFPDRRPLHPKTHRITALTTTTDLCSNIITEGVNVEWRHVLFAHFFMQSKHCITILSSKSRCCRDVVLLRLLLGLASIYYVLYRSSHQYPSTAFFFTALTLP